MNLVKQHTNNVLATASEDEEITEGQIHMQSEQACSPAALDGQANSPALKPSRPLHGKHQPMAARKPYKHSQLKS